MKKVLITLTEGQLKELNKMIKDGIYHNRSEAVRDAVRGLLEMRKMKELNNKLK